MNELLKPYVPLVDFLADYLGSNAEVLLHDLTNLEHSIVKIRNGHISGRKEGDPCTDFALRIVQQPPEDKQYSTNYKSCHKDGFPMKSGTFFIRNAGNRIIGMLCINIDSTQYTQMRIFLDSFFGNAFPDALISTESGNGETLGKSIVETMDAIIAKTVADFGGQTAVLSPERKEQIIHRLNDEGVFQLKGAVSKAAAALNLSEPSVYRYLNNLKKTSVDT